MVREYNFFKDIRLNILSILTILFFFAYLRMYFVGNGIDGYFFYAISVLMAVIGFFNIGMKWKLSVLLFIIVIFITGILNVFFVGNNTISKLMYSLICVGIVAVLGKNDISRATFLFSYYMFYLLIGYKMFFKGVQHIFAYSSENYVSVILMMPLFLFYSKFESKDEKVPIIHAILYAIICILAGGRTGIMIGILLVLGIAIYNYYFIGKKNKVNKFFVFMIGSIALIVIVFSILENMTVIANRFTFLEHFQRSGFSSKSRLAIWSEYYLGAIHNLKSFLLGWDCKNGLLIRAYNGNPHNSFLNIHMYNGVILLIILFVMSIRTIILKMKRKQYMFCISFFLFIVRSFFDSVFWNNYGTVFFMFFILTPYLFDKDVKRKAKVA